MGNRNHGIVPERVGDDLPESWNDTLARAAKHEDIALSLSQHFDRVSVTKAAAHFAVADALRCRAWKK